MDHWCSETQQDSWCQAYSKCNCLRDSAPVITDEVRGAVQVAGQIIDRTCRYCSRISEPAHPRCVPVGHGCGRWGTTASPAAGRSRMRW